MSKNDLTPMISYAQNFEDVILERIFKDLHDGFYVDIGACHPLYDSVTQHFYLKGWSGINVEPQPQLFTLLQAQRPRDTSLNICIGNSPGRQTLYITADLGTSTLDSSLAQTYRQQNRVTQEIDAEVRTLSDIWENVVAGRHVDFLKIDVEGFEKKVLDGVDFTLVCPSIIVIEAVSPGSGELSCQQWEPLLLPHYEPFYFDGLNRFYRRRDFVLDLPLCSTPPNVFDRFISLREHLAQEACRYNATQIGAYQEQLGNYQTLLAQKDAALADAQLAYEHLAHANDNASNDAAQAAESTHQSQDHLRTYSPGHRMTEQSNIHRTCIFTIVSNNYLHYANTLFESLQEHCPEADLVLGLCDRKSAETECGAASEIIGIEQLDIPELATFIYQYSILELNTAIKPYLIELLMKRGYHKVIYFDPDIRVFRPLDEMLGLLDQHNVLLTPHLTDLLDDGKSPTELQILQAGSYNLGYIALRTCDETRKLTKWWQDKLYKECVVDLPRNLFVDQKWMDLVPSLFDGVYVNRDPSWNVAYWNLNHRPLQRAVDGGFTVNGQPLTFFHFSGFSIEASTLSKHQNRFSKNTSPALRELCSLYEQALTRNGVERFRSRPYAFSRFADGTPVPDSARRLIRTSTALAGLDFFTPEQCPHVHAILNQPQPGHNGGIALTALAIALWESRADLREAFPAVHGIDSIRFAEWLLDAAPREAGFTDLYLNPIRTALEQARASQLHSLQGEGVLRSMTSPLFRLIWRQRRRIPLNLRIALAPYAGWVLNRAYPRPQLPQLPPGPPSSEETGINLIGYLHAESGVGEAARASLRALRSSNLPYSLIDYRLGNISRMGETVDSHTNQAYYPINLLHVNADQSKIARDYLGSELFKGRYTIGYWYWEMPVFPDFLHFAYDQVDEIWVSTEYNRQAISQFTDKPVTLIPPAVEVCIEKPLSRSELHLPEDNFIFLHTSDALSIPQRKNPMGVVHAFRMAFGNRPDIKVKLVIKISNLEHQPELAEEIFASMEEDQRIQLIHEYLDRNTLNNLMNACDCYVSLHRAEGFGLPIAEAMYLGKPVIATHWSGNVDFMNESNSLPVAYRLVALAEDIGPYKKNQIWAEPDLADAAKRMLEIALDKESACAISFSAKATIRALLSPENIAGKINQRISEIPR